MGGGGGGVGVLLEHPFVSRTPLCCSNRLFCSNHPLSPNYFIIMGNFMKSWVNLTNRTPLTDSPRHDVNSVDGP